MTPVVGVAAIGRQAFYQSTSPATVCWHETTGSRACNQALQNARERNLRKQLKGAPAWRTMERNSMKNKNKYWMVEKFCCKQTTAFSAQVPPF